MASWLEVRVQTQDICRCFVMRGWGSSACRESRPKRRPMQAYLRHHVEWTSLQKINVHNRSAVSMHLTVTGGSAGFVL